MLNWRGEQDLNTVTCPQGRASRFLCRRPLHHCPQTPIYFNLKGHCHLSHFSAIASCPQRSMKHEGCSSAMVPESSGQTDGSPPAACNPGGRWLCRARSRSHTRAGSTAGPGSREITCLRLLGGGKAELCPTILCSCYKYLTSAIKAEMPAKTGTSI